MKKILITGENSYIGNSTKKWLSRWPEKYTIDRISLKSNEWKKRSFNEYDVVLHVSGIVHTKERNSKIYYKINRDLTYEVAKKSKKEGVKQFIFLSTMNIYGIENGCISPKTIPKPKSDYGISKFEAEKLIKQLKSDSFTITILRPPMVYGKGCSGNYKKLSYIYLYTPIFPEITNKRSMIYIDNLTELIRILIDRSYNGTFLPQNRELVNTSDMVKLIVKNNDKKMVFTKVFNPIINVLTKKISVINKIFGDLYYEYQDINFNYNVVDLEESISLTERGKEDE